VPLSDLLAKLQHVRAHELVRHAQRFRRLAEEGQHPSVLFVACSDSRIVPSLLTGAEPGELFIVRTVGNIVHPLEDAGPADPTAAAVEFAVGVLGVRDVVVCGHSRCGAMAALYEGVPDGFDQLAGWLEHARPAALPREQLADLDARTRDARTAQRNVLLALDRLAADPLLAERRDAGELDLHGWLLDIATLEMTVFDPATGAFEPVGPVPGAGASPAARREPRGTA
jgi:carbonic anhydrase